MTTSTPALATVKQFVGEFPLHGSDSMPGLYDMSPDTTVGERQATNAEVLELLARIGGGTISITNPVTPEGVLYNALLTNCPLTSASLKGFLLGAVIFEQSL